MIKYRKRRKYKYTLHEDFPLNTTYPTGIFVGSDFSSEFLEIDENGNLKIRAGYSWDGASYFFDLKTILKGSLVHDALYQLMRENVLKQSDRDAADRIIQKICIESGMSRWLANNVYVAVKLFGKGSASNVPLTAP